MALSIPRAIIDERFREIRTLLSHVKTMESVEVPPVDTEETKILRGLFYVHLYGALEQSLNEVAEGFLREIAALGLKNWDFSVRFLPTAMNAHLKGLADTQTHKKWQKRLDFVNAIYDGENCRIETSVFSPHLQNSEIDTIGDILSYLGISPDMVKLSADRFYVDEVVQKRHQVAHGRATPASVGARGRSSDLELRLEAVRRTIDLFAELLERHYDSFEFLNAPAQGRLLEDAQQ